MDSTLLLESPRGAQTGRARTAVVICGMHRSGTSALTRIISLLGAGLPKHLYPPGLGNETGHWEPEAAIALNDDMLRSSGTHVNALWDADGDWFSSPVARGFVHKAKRLLDEEYGDEPLLVLKDPRISLFIPIWNAALGELGIIPHIIICVRHPIEVAQSLASRQTAAFPHEAWDLDRGGLLWLRYILSAERHSRQSSRVFCDYADLLADWRGTLRRLSTVLGVTWPRWSPLVENEVDSFLRADLRHQHAPQMSSKGGAWQDLIYPVYDALRDQQEPPPALIDSIAAEYRRAMRILGCHLAELTMKNAQIGSAAPAKPAEASMSASDAAIVRAAEAEHEAVEAQVRAEDPYRSALARAEQAENTARSAEYERDNICQQRDEAREMLRRFIDERIEFSNRAGRERDVAIKAEERARVEATMWQERATNLGAEVIMCQERAANLGTEAAMWQERAANLGAEVAMWQEHAANLETEAAMWRSRYEAVRRRLLGILRRFGVVFIASRLPVRLRRSAAATVFGPPAA